MLAQDRVIAKQVAAAGSQKMTEVQFLGASSLQVDQLLAQLLPALAQPKGRPVCLFQRLT